MLNTFSFCKYQKPGIICLISDMIPVSGATVDSDAHWNQALHLLAIKTVLMWIVESVNYFLFKMSDNSYVICAS